MIKLALKKSYQLFKDQNRPHLVSEGWWVCIGQASSVLGILILMRILTTDLSPSEYGELALCFTAITFVNQIIMGGVAGGIGRFYVIAIEKNDLDCYLAGAIKIFIYFLYLLLFIALILFFLIYSYGNERHINYFVMSLIYSLLLCIYSVYYGTLIAIRRRKITAILNILDYGSRIAVVIVMTKLLDKTVFTVLLAYIFSALIVVLICLIYSRKIFIYPKNNASKGSINHWVGLIWKYSWPFSVFGIFTWLQQASDRWILGELSSLEIVGQYAVLFTIGHSSITLCAGLMKSFIVPIMYEKVGALSGTQASEVSTSYTKILLTSVWVFGATSFLGAYFFHDQIYKIFVGQQFQQNSYLLAWMVIAAIFFEAGQILALKLTAELRSSAQIIPKIATSILGVGLSIFGAYLYGINGVVGAQILFSLLYFLSMKFLQINYKIYG